MTPGDSVRKKSPQDFVFGKAIGEGSFSTVYLAKDIHTNREYASKFYCKFIIIVDFHLCHFGSIPKSAN